MQVWHNFTAVSALFSDDHLVSCAGLVPVMTLATQTGLPQLLAEAVRITGTETGHADRRHVRRRRLHR